MYSHSVRPDAKGRILLGVLAKGISSFKVSNDEKHHRIILEPQVEIPAREKWLFENKVAFKKVQVGLTQSAGRQLIDRGSFGRYAKS